MKPNRSTNTPVPMPQKRLRVGFLLAQNFTLSAFANFVDVLRLAADEADRSRPIYCDWAVLSDSMEPVRSSCGVRVTPDTSLRRADAFDYIVVVGGVMSDEVALSAAERRFLTAYARTGAPLVALCTGVFILRELGLLDGYRCCVSWFHHQDFINRFEEVEPVSDRIFVVDRDRLTCSGGHGAAHLAAFLVSRHVGQSAATKSLNIMMIDDALRGDEAQPAQQIARKVTDDLVKRAILKMQQNVELPLTVTELAAGLRIGRRTLERRFLSDLGRSPSKIYLDLRLDRALTRLRKTTDTVTEVGLATGFCDGTHLARALKSERGITPAEFRRAQGVENGEPQALTVLHRSSV